MKLFNKTIDKQLFKQYALGSDLSKQEVVAKIFNPQGAQSWFILNSDPEDPDYLWAIVDLGYGAEIGSVSRNELESYRGRFGLGFERDLSFDPINAEELYEGLRRGKYYADGGEVSFIDYKDCEIMYEPHYKKYYANDVEFDSLKEAQEFIDSGEIDPSIRDAYSKGMFADGGSVNVGYNVFNYTDNIYATNEVFKTKALANKFIKEFRSRFSNQGYYRDNRMNKINIQDIDLLAIPSDFNPFKKFADGGGVENKIQTKNFADLKQGDVIRRKEKLGTTIFVVVKSPVQSRAYKNEYNALVTCIVGNTDYYKPFEEYHITSVIKYGKLGNVDYIGKWNHDDEVDYSKYLPKSNKKYADGGDIANFSDNQRMIMNQNVELEHHHEELEDILEDEIPVPAWVVAKMATATNSVSDVTHYLDGQKELMEDENEDENEDEDEDEDREAIENKEVVEPINVSAGTKAELTKKFTDDAWGNLRGFLKGMEGIDLRDDYTFDYRNEQFEVEPIINSDENGVSNAVFTIFDGDGEEVGEFTYSREGGKQKFTANSDYFQWNNAKFEDGGYFDGTIPKVSTYMSNYADGGQVEYEIEYRDSDGDEYSESFKTLEEANAEISKLQKAGFKITDKMKHKVIDGHGTFIGRFEDGGFMNGVYAEGGKVDSFIPNVGTIDTFMLKSMLIKNPDVKSILSDKEFEFLKNENTDAIGVNNKPFNTIITDGNQEIEFDLKKNVVVKHLTEARDKIKSHYSTNYAKGGEVAKAEILGFSRNVMGTTDIEMKITGMRKPQDFIVYPIGKDDAGNVITIQSDTRIGQINLVKGVGVMSQSHSSGAYFVHLQMDKLTSFTISESDLEDIKAHVFKTAGANVGTRGIVTDNSGASGVYAKGGITYYKNENERLSRPKSDMEEKVFEKVKNQINSELFIGNFGWRTDNRKQANIAYGYLYSLDDFDKNLIKNLKLKQGEEVFRYVTRVTAISGMMPFIKINIEKALLYFPMLNDSDDIVFETRGVTPLWISLIEGSFADGGNLKKNLYPKEVKVEKKDVSKFKEILNEIGIKSPYSEDISDKQFNIEQIAFYFKNEDDRQKAFNKYHQILADGGFMNNVYAKGGSVKKDWWHTVVNPNEDFNNFDDKMPIDWEVDDFKSWVVSNSDLDGNVDKEVLEVVKIPKSKLTVEYLNKNGSGKNNNEFYKEFGNWQSALYDIFTQMKKDYLFKKSLKYVLKADIKTVTVKTKNGKEVTYNGADVLNGNYVLAKGGDITSKATYFGKNNVVGVELKDGTTIKPANGYWVKKGAEPIGAEPTPTSSSKSEPKMNTTQIRKDARGNWRAETNVENFNGYDWRISTLKTYTGNLVSSAQGGKTESTGTKGIVMFKYAPYEDPNHTLEVSKPKRLTDKVVSEQHDKALAKFKKFMETGMFKGGGKISNFDKLSDKVAKEYEGKPVKSQYQEEYGKYYSKEEAQEVGDKVAGKVKAMQTDSKAFGGLFSSAKSMVTPKKYPELEGKQVALKTGKFVQVFTQAGSTLSVLELGKVGSGERPYSIDISEVDLTSYEAGGQTSNKKVNSSVETLKKANILAKEIRKDGESWLDAKKRAFAQLKK